MSIAHNQGSAYGGSSSSTSSTSSSNFTSTGYGVSIDITDVRSRVESLLSENFTRRKALQKIVRSVVTSARRKIRSDARSYLTNDPRQAYKAVRMSIYKRILGGNVNILTSTKGNTTTQAWNPTRTLRPGQRGGNRRSERSARTQQLDNYYGVSRGFILRFLNAGTSVRETRFGARGSLYGSDWFGVSSTIHMEEAVQELSQLLDRAATELWNEG